MEESQIFAEPAEFNRGSVKQKPPKENLLKILTVFLTAVVMLGNASVISKDGD